VNEFLPEIINLVYEIFGDPDYEKFLKRSVEKLNIFVKEYFYKDIEGNSRNNTSTTLFPYLEEIVNNLPEKFFFSNKVTDKRRKTLLLLLFLIKYESDLDINTYENFSTYIRQKFLSLSDLGKKEFLYGFNKLAVLDKNYVNPDSYFSEINDQEYLQIKHIFYDRYLKDEYVQEILETLNLNKKQITSFKQSIKLVSLSDKFNLLYLSKYVNKRKKYKRLFLITSSKRLPKRIQTYITQSPFFILRPSSIVNLPKIGISERFDIFFFSPRKFFATSKSLLDEFKLIDNRISEHPMKIYLIDPAESLGISLQRRTDFSQAIGFFENRTFNSEDLDVLSFNQTISLLENNQISLRNILCELPISEFSSSILDSEKEFINNFAEQWIISENEKNIFQLLNFRKEINKQLNKISIFPISYDENAVGSILEDTSAESISKRIKIILDEILSNLESIKDMLV
jgi:hypothetical protein